MKFLGENAGVKAGFARKQAGKKGLHFISVERMSKSTLDRIKHEDWFWPWLQKKKAEQIAKIGKPMEMIFGYCPWCEEEIYTTGEQIVGKITCRGCGEKFFKDKCLKELPESP